MKNNIFKIWIGTSMVTITIISIITKSSILQILSAILGIVYLYGNVTENKYGQLFGVGHTALYGIIMLSTGLYGTAIYNLLYCIPMQIYTFFTWGKDEEGKNKKEISRYTTLQREYGMIILVIIILAYTAIATRINISFALVDGISIILGILGMYLVSQKKIEQWYLWIISNLAMLSLWIIKSFESISNLPMVIMWVVYLVNNTCGFVSWSKKLKAKEKVNK